MGAGGGGDVCGVAVVPIYSTDSLRPVPVPCELICRSYVSKQVYHHYDRVENKASERGVLMAL